jgi:fermentation-respiration switch protein FrsA (DUF1100 family)
MAENDKEKKKTSGSAVGTALGFAACAAAGGLLGAANYFFNLALVPKQHDPAQDNRPGEEAYTAGRRWMRGHVARQDVFTFSGDGKQLHGNLIRQGDPDCHRYAILVHGFGDSAEAMGLYGKQYYEEYGMHVLLPDLRGHGASEGSFVGMGWQDSADLARWVSFITSMDPDAVIVMHGISMGAAAILQATGKSLPGQVKAVVSDCAFADCIDELTYQYKKHEESYPAPVKKLIPAPLMVQLVRLIGLVRAHYDIGKASPVEAVRRSLTPTLFIHGEDDDVIPPDDMPRLYEAANCEKHFLWVKHAGHCQSVVVDPDRYWGHVTNFYNDVSPWILNDNITDADPFADL